MTDHPTIHAICGLPGTGKTHYAERLSKETGAQILSRDAIRAELFSSPDFSAEEKDAAFRVMLARAGERLRAGKDVILDGMPFSRRSERDRVRELAKQTRAEARFVLCTCDEQTALARIEQSTSHPAKDRNANLYLKVKARFEAFGPDEEYVEVKS